MDYKNAIIATLVLFLILLGCLIFAGAIYLIFAFSASPVITMGIIYGTAVLLLLCMAWDYVYSSITERDVEESKMEYDTSDKEIELKCFPLRNSFEHHVGGSISIARVYNKALTPEEIKHLYKTGGYVIDNKYRYSPIGI